MTTALTPSADENLARDRSETLAVSREQRYPLDLSVRIPELRQLYLESNASIWDVTGELDVTAIDVDALSGPTRAAAAVSWSRRSWTNFADISESEAALVRCCIERDRAADLKYVLAARGTERAVATDACHQIAARFGSHRAQPPTPELQTHLSTDTIRRALDARVDFDAFFIAHFVVLATLDRALLTAAEHHTTEPVCLQALQRIAVDVKRQEAAGRIYLSERLPDLDTQTRAVVASNAAAVVRSDVLSGVRCPALLPASVSGAADLMAAEADTAASGLGAAPLHTQRDVVLDTLHELDTELNGLGLETTLAAAADQIAPQGDRP